MTRPVWLVAPVLAMLTCREEQAPLGEVASTSTAHPSTAEPLAVPTTLSATSALSGASQCAICHTEIAEEWRTSMHHTSYSDGTFQAALGIEQEKDRTFCIHCHAPEASVGAGTNEDGVSCASCHAAPHSGGTDGTATCARCHEFNFDDARGERVQKTLSEHATSPFANVACATCHMKMRPGFEAHRDHRFVAGHDPADVARSVRVDLRLMPTARRVQAQIQTSAGHAFPTGDMFRRVRLRIFGDNGTGQVAFATERTFQRTWSTIASGPQKGARTETADTRIRGTWREEIPLESTEPLREIRWELLYERVVVVRGEQTGLASSDVIAEGSLLVPAVQRVSLGSRSGM